MIQIIPAIDLIDGQCVRLTQGQYDTKTVYSKDPVDMARRYADCGVSRLHVVDLDGAKASAPVNLRVLEGIVSATGLQVQFGGGIKSSEALESVYNAGAARAICGSIAVKSPELFGGWLERYGGAHVTLGADTRNGRIAVNGWLDSADTDVDQLIELFTDRGLQHVICTDITRDGMLQGPATDLYVRLRERFPDVETTVSGGISAWDDIERLDALGLPSVIVGKAIYEGRITLQQLEKYNASC